MATSADQINTTHLTQLMILNLGSRNACMRALIAHPTDLNAAANWLINHRNDANIDTDPFAARTATTTTTTTTTTSNTNTTNTYSNRYQTTTNINTNTNTNINTTQQHTQQHMIQQVMNLGYTRDEALRAYTNVTTSDRNETNKLVDYLVKNPKKENKKSTYNTYSSNSSYYPYSSSNKKKVYRPVINIDDIKVEKEEICDIEDCECLEHIGIILREYKKFLNKNCVAANNANNANNENNNENSTENYEKNGFYAYFLEKISGDGEYTLSDVMDDFIHLIKKHDIRYGEYSKIYKYIISKDSLNGILSTDKYNLLQRITLCNSLSDFEINKLYFGFKSIKEITIQQLCDKMYCYLVLTYTIGGKLEYDKYLLLDKKYDIPPMKQHKETGKIKEKSISQYIGSKEYVNYLQLLYNNNKQNEIIINKFYCAFNVEQLEIRVDPKELKSKLAREKREKKRKLLEEKKRLKALEDNKKEEKEDNKKEEESVALPSVLPSKIIEEKDNNKKEDNNNKKEDNNKKEFSFGVRYNYWPKDNEDLIGITIREDDAKYLTLKDELIGNGLSIFSYNILLEKANIFISTEYCQDTIEAGVNPFGIKLLDKITIKHIISLMIYCNYNKIRNKFILTFVRQNNGKEDNISMIKRHSNFYHLGKLLRESVECYGEEAHRSETKVFYHSINMNKKIMSDSEIKSLFIYTPFSTTSCMEICLNNKPELIMELKGYVSKYFDCSWISDLCFEKEQIFCGGTRALTINKCIDGKYGYDHKLFINSIKYIPNIFKTNVSEWKINKNDDMLQETKEMIRNLLYYQLNKSQNKFHNKYPNNLSKLGIPLDIEQSLNQFCISTNSIRMHYDAMYNHRAYGFLSSLFMTPTRTFTKLNVITQLFPRINTFSMISTPLTTLTFLYIKSYISTNNNNNNNNEEEEKDDYKNNQQQPPSQITEIRLIDPKTAAMSIEQVIQAEKKSLAQLQWIIQSNDQVSLVLKYSDKPVIIKEPTPPPQPIIEEKKEEKKQDQKQKRVRKKIRRKKVVKKLKQGENQNKSNEPGAVVVSSTDNKGTEQQK